MGPQVLGQTCRFTSLKHQNDSECVFVALFDGAGALQVHGCCSINPINQSLERLRVLDQLFGASQLLLFGLFLPIGIPGYLSVSLSPSVVWRQLLLPYCHFRWHFTGVCREWEPPRDTRDVLPPICTAARVNLVCFGFPKPNNRAETVFTFPFPCCNQNRRLT